jgi:CheY-like chemotaxis protein
LRIGRGHRRGPRRDVTGATLLDADTLHCSALVDAVAQVAGRTRTASFTATAPTAPTAAAAERPPTPVRPQARVLVAEDNLVNQEIIRQQLALLGVEIEVVGDGETAFARWQAGGHALLLTDVHMPGISGCELVERIRAHEGTQAHLPIVALTAAAVHDETTRCRDAGVDDVLCKPASLEQLAQMLQRWLPPTTTTREEGSPA